MQGAYQQAQRVISPRAADCNNGKPLAERKHPGMPPKRGLQSSKTGASKKQKATGAEASKGAPAVDIEECSFTAEEVSQVCAILQFYTSHHHPKQRYLRLSRLQLA